MRKELRQAVLFTAITTLLCGGIYHATLWAVGRVAFRSQADGSVIVRADGTIVGSRLIAQSFARPEYFQSRPSGVDYNAASAGGTNYGPSNPDHLKAVRERLDAIDTREQAQPAQVPSDLITASGSGLDPHISPASAELQAARVASARGVALDRVRELIRAHTEQRLLGLFGQPRVNVLELNLALDQALGVKDK